MRSTASSAQWTGGVVHHPSWLNRPPSSGVLADLACAIAGGARAISAGLHERQHLPVDDSELEEDGGRFSQDGWWTTPPVHWADEAVDRMVAPEQAARVRQLVEELTPAQRQVVTLRDVEGLPSADVCSILGISEGNQRVLLHRARARIRRHLEQEAVW